MNLAMNVAWCACFVSWCANQARISTKAIPPYCSCGKAVSTFKSMGVYHPRNSYRPKRGDIIFFDWGGDTWPDHTGIVESIDSRYVHTIEGNSGGNGGQVKRKAYALTYTGILGYADWDSSGPDTSTTIKECQQYLNTHYSSGLTVDGSFGPASKTALIKAIQQVLGVKVDGYFNQETQKVFPNLVAVKVGEICALVQIALVANGFVGVEIDKSYGTICKSSTMEFQRKNNLIADGSVGKNTMLSLLNKLPGDTVKGNETTPVEPEKPVEEPQKPVTPIVECQKKLNEKFGANLELDGSWGPSCKKALIVAIQKTLNKDYGKTLITDGSFGPATRNAVPDVKSVTKGNLALCIQIGLKAKGYKVDLDGSYGPACKTAITSFQKSVGLKQDGICGSGTLYSLTK